MASRTGTTARPSPLASRSAGLLGAGRWLLRPAIEAVPVPSAVALTVVRLLVGVLWLYNAGWKVPPDFGQDDRSGLFVFTGYAVSHPVFPPYSWVVEHVVLPQFIAFGWAVLVLETTLAALMLSGSFVRVAALLGLAQSVAIGLSVARAPNEWPWSYALMVAVHLLVLFGGAGRYLAVDALRAARADGTGLSRLWGGLSLVAGVVAIVGSLGNPLGPNGANLRLTGLEFGIGSYNALAGVVLVVVGAAILAWSALPTLTWRWLAWAAAALGVAAALSLSVQIGFRPPLLGGTATSAAFLLTLAVVAAALARYSERTRPG